jgi:hypothetical protein
MTNAYKFVVGKSEGKRPLGRPRRRWKNNLTSDHKGTGYEVVEWVHVA